MFDITKRTTITTDWAQLKTVQEQMNLAEIMLEVGSEFPICLEADADNENDAFEQLTAQVVHVTKEGRVMVVLKDCMEKMRAMNDYATNKGGWKDSAMRKWLNEDVLPRLPKELQAMIVPRTIRQKINGEEVQMSHSLYGLVLHGCRRLRKCSAQRRRLSGRPAIWEMNSLNCLTRNAAA